MKLLKFILLLTILFYVSTKNVHKKKHHKISHHIKQRFLQINDDNEDYGDDYNEKLESSDKSSDDLEEKLAAEVEKYNQSTNSAKTRINMDTDNAHDTDEDYEDSM